MADQRWLSGTRQVCTSLRSARRILLVGLGATAIAGVVPGAPALAAMPAMVRIAALASAAEALLQPGGTVPPAPPPAMPPAAPVAPNEPPPPAAPTAKAPPDQTPGAALPPGSPAAAAPLQVYDQIQVTGRGSDMVGIADSATQGVTGHEELQERPILRPGEVLETVPGLIISQHSGDGKANQYYLRGFNLDHGTDFSFTVDDIPINQPSNGHGQGYTDLNFLIPELVDTVRYEKGLYYADKGDFSAAGAADIGFVNSLDKGLAEITGGTFGYQRGLVADSAKVAGGDLLAAVELEHYDGPWVRPDDYRKENGLVRYNSGDVENGFTMTLGAYNGEWSSTDQIPLRAVEEGLISRFGSIDPTDEGSSYRYSLVGELRRGDDASLTTLSTFIYNSKLKLFSDFTYFLEDPVHGDQFEQFDYRTVEGFNLKHEWATRLCGHEVESMIGMQGRNDNIHNGLYHTEDDQILSLTRQDEIDETSIGPFAQARVRWTKWLRTVLGIRADYYHFNVDSNLAANSGFRDRAIAEPKLSVLLGPWRDSEFYLNFGEGFHSNDARGTTITVDPRTGQPVGPVSPLVRAKSADVGFRTSLIPNLQTAISFFRLDLASELVFDGDAGDTEPSRPSRRLGVEVQNFYRPISWLVVDADFAVSHARFTDFETIGDHIPGAVETTGAMGVTVPAFHDFFGSLRWRYFGPRPLIEDDSVRSHQTSLFYFDFGHPVTKDLRLTFSIFNLFNTQASDIDYYYTSRLPGEPAAGVNDIHFHPSEPRSYRLTAAYRF
jgi:hypothetical protein